VLQVGVERGWRGVLPWAEIWLAAGVGADLLFLLAARARGRPPRPPPPPRRPVGARGAAGGGG
jgi:hypothetical protein